MSKYEVLIRSINRLFTNHSVRPWSERSAEWITNLPGDDDRQGWIQHAQSVLSAYGGMGSINDVYISPQAGDAISDDIRIIRKVNQELKTLVGELYSEAMRLSRQ